MPDAWEILIGNSSAPAGSDAWTHLNSQQGGGGVTVAIDGGLTISEEIQLVSIDGSDSAQVAISEEVSLTQITEEEYSVLINGDDSNVNIDS